MTLNGYEVRQIVIMEMVILWLLLLILTSILAVVYRFKSIPKWEMSHVVTVNTLLEAFGGKILRQITRHLWIVLSLYDREFWLYVNM